jgi:hypothetical protein
VSVVRLFYFLFFSVLIFKYDWYSFDNSSATPIGTYNYKDLKERLPKIFDDLLDVSFVRRVFQHCLRFMSGYRQNLKCLLLYYAMRKYASH